MEYADHVLWDGCTDGGSKLLESIHCEAWRVVTVAMKGISRISLMPELGWDKMKVRGDIHFILRISSQLESKRELSLLFDPLSILVFSLCAQSIVRGLSSLPQLNCGTTLI